MGHDQSDEPDRPRHRDRAADRERGARDEPQPEAQEIEPETLRAVLAQRQGVQRRGGREQQRPAFSWFVPNEPPSMLPVTFGGPEPAFVVMEMTPPIASEPYSPLCGPRKTSMRAISPVSS